MRKHEVQKEEVQAGITGKPQFCEVFLFGGTTGQMRESSYPLEYVLLRVSEYLVSYIEWLGRGLFSSCSSALRMLMKAFAHVLLILHPGNIYPSPNQHRPSFPFGAGAATVPLAVQTIINLFGFFTGPFMKIFTLHRIRTKIAEIIF